MITLKATGRVLLDLQWFGSAEQTSAGHPVRTSSPGWSFITSFKILSPGQMISGVDGDDVEGDMVRRHNTIKSRRETDERREEGCTNRSQEFVLLSFLSCFSFCRQQQQQQQGLRLHTHSFPHHMFRAVSDTHTASRIPRSTWPLVHLFRLSSRRSFLWCEFTVCLLLVDDNWSKKGEHADCFLLPAPEKESPIKHHFLPFSLSVTYSLISLVDDVNSESERVSNNKGPVCVVHSECERGWGFRENRRQAVKNLLTWASSLHWSLLSVLLCSSIFVALASVLSFSLLSI